MKGLIAAGFAVVLVCTSSPIAAQKASAQAERATQAYQHGWESFHHEQWADAAKLFQQAIDLDPKFALAYYALGRADMAQKKFVDATKAYIACRDLYLARAGERYTNQVEANQRRADQILEYRAALRHLNQTPLSQTQSNRQAASQIQLALQRLEQSQDRNANLTIDATVPYFVPMALGAAYFRSEHFADAEREYKIAVEANPNSGETHNNLAVLYLVLNRLDESAKEITLAEKTGFQVNPGLKEELRLKRGR